MVSSCVFPTDTISYAIVLSLYRAVIDPTDYQRHTIFSLMQDIPDLLGRLIGIITKCDMKQEGSDTWVGRILATS